MDPYSSRVGERRKRKTLEGDSPDGLREIIAVFGEVALEVNHPMKSLALTWGSVGEGAERFEDEEVDELTTFRSISWQSKSWMEKIL